MLPLYFVRGLSPERAIRAAAAGASLRKPVPVLHGNKTQTENGKAGLFLVKWFIETMAMNGCFWYGIPSSHFSWSVFLYLECDKTKDWMTIFHPSFIHVFSKCLLGASSGHSTVLGTGEPGVYPVFMDQAVSPPLGLMSQDIKQQRQGQKAGRRSKIVYHYYY